MEIGFELWYRKEVNFIFGFGNEVLAIKCGLYSVIGDGKCQMKVIYLHLL